MGCRIVPMIQVPDVRTSIRWYETIGFTLLEVNEDDGEIDWALLSLDGGELMINAGGRAATGDRRDADLYIHADNVDALYDSLKDKVEIAEPPSDAFHGHRELILRDPDGFWVIFGQPIADR